MFTGKLEAKIGMIFARLGLQTFSCVNNAGAHLNIWALDLCTYVRRAQSQLNDDILVCCDTIDGREG